MNRKLTAAWSPCRHRTIATAALALALIASSNVLGQTVDFSEVLLKSEGAVFSFVTDSPLTDSDKPGAVGITHSFEPNANQQPNTLPPNPSKDAASTMSDLGLKGYTWSFSPTRFKQSAVAVENADGKPLVLTLISEPADGTFTIHAPATGQSYSELKPVVFDESIGAALFQVEAADEIPSLRVSEDTPAQGSAVVALWIDDKNLIASHGIVASKPRFHRVLQREVVELSTQVRPGSLGGAVLNADGELLGIIVASVGLKPEQGSALMIPATCLAPALEAPADASSSTTLHRGFLGVHLDQASDALVTQVNPNSAAEKMGLEVGDQLMSLNGDPVASLDDFILKVRRLRAGDELTLKYQTKSDEEDEQEGTATLKIGEPVPLQMQYLLSLSADGSGSQVFQQFSPALQTPSAAWNQAIQANGQNPLQTIYLTPSAQQLNPANPPSTATPSTATPSTATPPTATPSAATTRTFQPNVNLPQGFQFVPAPVLTKGPRIEVERSDLEEAIRNLSKQIEDLQQQLKEKKR